MTCGERARARHVFTDAQSKSAKVLPFIHIPAITRKSTGAEIRFVYRISGSERLERMRFRWPPAFRRGFPISREIGYAGPDNVNEDGIVYGRNEIRGDWERRERAAARCVQIAKNSNVRRRHAVYSRTRTRMNALWSTIPVLSFLCSSALHTSRASVARESFF